MSIGRKLDVNYYVTPVTSPAMRHWGTCPPPGLPTISFLVRSLWSKSESQLSKYCVVCEISWCRCQQLTALSISTALVIKLLDIEQLLHQTLKFAMSAPWHNFHLCPSSQQILKLLRTNNIDTVKICQSQFCFELPSSVIKKRAIKFETSLKYA